MHTPLKLVFDPQTKEWANQEPRVLICDGFGTHKILKILESCFEKNITLYRLLSLIHGVSSSPVTSPCLAY